MKHDLDELLRRDARRLPGTPGETLAARIANTVRRAPTRSRSPWSARIAWTAIAAAAVLALLATLQSHTEAPTLAPAAPGKQAWLGLDPAPAHTLGRSETLLLREVVLMRNDARNALGFVLDRIPARVRPLMLIDRML